MTNVERTLTVFEAVPVESLIPPLMIPGNEMLRFVPVIEEVVTAIVLAAALVVLSTFRTLSPVPRLLTLKNAKSWSAGATAVPIVTVSTFVLAVLTATDDVANAGRVWFPAKKL